MQPETKHHSRLLPLIGTALAAAAGANLAHGQGYTVCPQGCAYSRIQEAIDAAAEGHIRIGPGVYREDLAVVDRSVTMQGSGSDRTVIMGTGTTSVLRLSCAGTPGMVRLTDLKITGGSALDPSPASPGGGGVLNLGCDLRIADSVVSDNRALTGGGGIYSTGPLRLRQSTVANNRSSFGGGIYAGGDTTIAKSMFSGNLAVCNISELGGAALLVLSSATASVSDSVFSGNTAASLCNGVLSNGGNLSLSRSEFKGNSSPALHNRATADLNQVSFEDNGYVGNTWLAGGIANLSPGVMTVSHSRVHHNTSFQSGGIENSGTMTLSHSVVTDNLGGFGAGGVLNSGTLNLVNVEITGNVSQHGVGGEGTGGGLFNTGTVTATNTTISGNTPDNCVGTPFPCP